MEEDFGAIDAHPRPVNERRRFLAPIVPKDEDHSPSISRSRSKTFENCSIWALEIVSTREELLGAFVIRESGISIFTADEILYE